MTVLGIHITNEEWLQLPLRLRQRWWDETDFGRVEPSEDLKNEIKKILTPPRPEPSVPFRKG